MAWWWLALSGVEVVWVLGVWLLLAERGAPPLEGGAARPRDARRTVFAWAYVLYHLPVLLLDYVTTGWWEKLLEGRGFWALVEAAVIGAVTVAAYGVVLTWLLT